MTRDAAWLPASDAGRLFRTIVVLGSSWALGCGGKTSVLGGDGDMDARGSGGVSSGSGGVSSGSGGAWRGSGGSPSASGGQAIGSGGSVGSGGDAADCAPEQWDCSGTQLESNYGGQPIDCTYILPDDCSCDVSRPLAPDDCPAGTVRTCLAAGADPQGDALDEMVAFACECLPFDPGAQHCSAACEAHGDTSPFVPSACFEEAEPYINILCGCELPILR